MSVGTDSEADSGTEAEPAVDSSADRASDGRDARFSIFDSLNDGILLAPAATLDVMYANAAAMALLRRPDLEGTNLLELVHPEELERAALGLALRADSFAQSFDLRGRLPATRFRGVGGDGSTVHLELSMTTVDDPDAMVVITFRPLALYYALDEALQSLASGGTLHEALGRAAEGYAHPYVPSEVGIAFDDADGHRHCVGPLPPRLAGVLPDGSHDEDPLNPWMLASTSGEPFVARSLDEVPEALHAAAHERGFRACIAVPIEDSASRRSACLVVWSQDPHGIDNHLFLFRDRPTDIVRLALERRAQVEMIEHAARHDALTDLLNRRAFFEPLATAKPPFAVLYIDLDGFKAVNDRLGHAVGDDVLVVTAERLRHVVRGRDRVARLGGDEFAVLAASVSDFTDAEVLAGRLIEELSAPIVIDGQLVRIGASVGIAMVSGPSCESTDDEIVRAADEALYEAKQAGKGVWRAALVG